MLYSLALLFFAFQANPRPHVILAIGDSMTAGYGVPAESSYPAQLGRALKSRGYDYRIVNQGVTGSTTTQALGRLTRALAVQPDIVIIQLGGNDVSQGISREVSRENVRTIIERFKPGGAQILFAGGRFPYLDALAQELNVPVIPFLDGVAGHPELLISDGIHPNPEGYAIVVQNIMKTLEPILRSHSSSAVAGRSSLMEALGSGNAQLAVAIIDEQDARVKSALPGSQGPRPPWSEISPVFIPMALEKRRMLILPDLKGWTPLMAAAEHGYTDIVKRLLAEDVPRDVQNSEGLTALQIAERAGNTDIVALLSTPSK